LNQRPQSVNGVSSGSVGRFCVTPASQSPNMGRPALSHQLWWKYDLLPGIRTEKGQSIHSVAEYVVIAFSRLHLVNALPRFVEPLQGKGEVGEIDVIR
jgi:hypothetical protein